MAPCPLTIPVAIPWFKAPSIQFWSLPQSVQRLWEYLKNISHGGANRFKIKDWELAEALDVGTRCVQKALKLAEALGLIRRYREYGRQGGRVIEIIIDLAGPKPKPRPTPGPASGPGDKGPGPAPTTTSPSPEQAAADRAREQARQQEQARQEHDRLAGLRDAWERLADERRVAIRDRVKAENPGVARWGNVLESLCLAALEAQVDATAPADGQRAGP
jgi:hypothetical protein